MNGMDSLTVVSGMLGSGTTYYTEFLNWAAKEKVAYHEHVYGVKELREPHPGQQYEVSGFAFPYHTDRLLVRDPRRVVRGLRYHAPYFHNFTEEHLGYRPNTPSAYVDAYLDLTYMALELDPPVVRIEDVPLIEGLRRNANRHGRRRPLTWAELGSELTALAKGWGYE